MPAKPQHAPATAAPIQYGAKKQTAIPEDTSPPLSADGIKHIQKAVGMFAWYSRATDPTYNGQNVELHSRKTVQSNRATKKGTAPIFGLLCNTSG